MHGISSYALILSGMGAYGELLCKGSYIADKESPHEKLITHPNQKFVTLSNGIRDRVWNIPQVVRFYDCFEPKLLYNKHKKDVVGKRLEPLNMIFGIFRKSIDPVPFKKNGYR